MSSGIIATAQAQDQDRWVGIKKAAEVGGVVPGTVRNWALSGLVRATRPLRGPTRYNLADIEALKVEYPLRSPLRSSAEVIAELVANAPELSQWQVDRIRSIMGLDTATPESSDGAD
jgi:hypothetical protein